MTEHRELVAQLLIFFPLNCVHMDFAVIAACQQHQMLVSDTLQRSSLLQVSTKQQR